MVYTYSEIKEKKKKNIIKMANRSEIEKRLQQGLICRNEATKCVNASRNR